MPVWAAGRRTDCWGKGDAGAEAEGGLVSIGVWAQALHTSVEFSRWN